MWAKLVSLNMNMNRVSKHPKNNRESQKKTCHKKEEKALTVTNYKQVSRPSKTSMEDCAIRCIRKALGSKIENKNNKTNKQNLPAYPLESSTVRSAKYCTREARGRKTWTHQARTIGKKNQKQTNHPNKSTKTVWLWRSTRNQHKIGALLAPAPPFHQVQVTMTIKKEGTSGTQKTHSTWLSLAIQRTHLSK